jgi:hypothetical protein
LTSSPSYAVVAAYIEKKKVVQHRGLADLVGYVYSYMTVSRSHLRVRHPMSFFIVLSCSLFVCFIALSRFERLCVYACLYACELCASRCVHARVIPETLFSSLSFRTPPYPVMRERGGRDTVRFFFFFSVRSAQVVTAPLQTGVRYKSVTVGFAAVVSLSRLFPLCSPAAGHLARTIVDSDVLLISALLSLLLSL